MLKRLFVTKKKGFDVEAENLLKDLKENLNIKNLESLKIYNRYDIEGIDDYLYEKAVKVILSETNIDNIIHESIYIENNKSVFGIEYLPGQYDQRADFAAQGIQIINEGIKPEVRCCKVYVLGNNISSEEVERIKKYILNPVDSREASLEKPSTLKVEIEEPNTVETIESFINFSEEEIENFLKALSMAMSLDDLKFVQSYFKNLKRNPTITEIKVLDTYWSDHCRHTTFMTKIENIEIEKSEYSDLIEDAYNEYLKSREYVYSNQKKDICLMDIATVAMKELRKKGLLDDLDVSEEINACSINIYVNVNGKIEKYLLMFKNETHNHPTEIEPFGGAATCLGGAIRDPLSGRSYVYQAMRVTGSADPRVDIKDTIDGKLPQRKITLEAAKGYSSYGNQIGLATGGVYEVYDKDFIAKRMEVGAVIAAAPKENVIRETPVEGDAIILLGGRTGRDGIGGAIGSSKEHSEESIEKCSAEVQKGDAPQERKIQRLFRNKTASQMIKRCNDFGAGGVCVAIGEISESLDINLDNIPKKYEGLDGTELAISESQERMAVVISKENIDNFIALCNEENLEASHVATVKKHGKVRMFWKGKVIVDIERDFLNTNGIKQKTNILVEKPSIESYFKEEKIQNIKNKWIDTLKDINVASQKGLVERFDSSIGAGTVIMPFGGIHQLTPTQGMVAKIPVLNGETNTSSIMTYGYNPLIGKWSPFHGAYYAVIESICKIVAIGGDYKKVRLTLQEYFEKLGKNQAKWGKPFSALLGAFYAQKKLNIPAIGGKDSMSGTFKSINVPPTLISFAVASDYVENIISPEFKSIGSKVVLLKTSKDEKEMLDLDELTKNFEKINSLIKDKKIVSAYAVGFGGVCEAISKMAFGNKIGVDIKNTESLFKKLYGSFVLELNCTEDELSGYNIEVLGTTIENSIKVNGEILDLNEIINIWSSSLEGVFKTKASEIKDSIENVRFENNNFKVSSTKIAKPNVFISAFPGTNCEYDCYNSFEKAGANANIGIFKNLTSNHIKESIDYFANEISKSQILMIPGGFSAGDEPDGSAKFIATIFRNSKIKEARNTLLHKNDGLILGICNGFQALIKLGLLPYGEIRDLDVNAPTLTYNKIGRHMSKMVTTKVTSNLSPWLYETNVGDLHSVAISHGEGRFVANEETLKTLIENGQISTQYVDLNGDATYDINYNPNGSIYAIEGICSPDGKIFGKMGHSERYTKGTFKNIYGNKNQKLFESGVKYFK